MFYKSRSLAKWSGIMTVLVMLLGVGACARPTPTPTPRPTPTATPVPLATPTPTPVPTPTPIKGEGQVVVLGFGIWEKQFRELVIPTFEKESGCKVNWFGISSTAMLVRLKAEAGKPTVDVGNMQMADKTAAKMDGLLVKNNRDILINLKFVHPRLLDPDDIGAPSFIEGGPVIAVRNDKLKEKNLPIPESWLDLANPLYRDKMAWVLVTTGAGRSVIAHLARALGGNEVNDYARAFDWIESKLKPNILAVVAAAEWTKLLTEGSVWVGMASWGRAAQTVETARQGGISLSMIWPKEGTNVDPVYFVTAKGAPNPICAQLWANYVLSKEVQEAVPEGILYGPSRTDVAISEKIKPLVVKPSDMDKAVELNWDAMGKNSPLWIETWNKIFGK